MIATIAGHWFYMSATIADGFATIAETELKSISAIVVATIAAIAEEWFPYDRNDR